MILWESGCDVRYTWDLTAQRGVRTLSRSYGFSWIEILIVLAFHFGGDCYSCVEIFREHVE